MLTRAQLAVLATFHLDPSRVVKDQRGNGYIEAWDVRRRLLEIFGWGGFDITVVSSELAFDGINIRDGQERREVVYRVVTRLTIKDPDGYVVATFEDGAAGGAINPSIEDAHDQALKSAMSGALKRCAVNLGTQFGLSLYNDGSLKNVVRDTLGHGGPFRVANTGSGSSGTGETEPSNEPANF